MMKKILSYLLVLSFLISCITAIPLYSSKETETSTQVVADTSLSGDNIKDVIFAPGKDATSFNFTWLGGSSTPEYLQYTESKNIVNGKMPENALSVTSSIDAVRRGYVARAYIGNLKENTEYSYRVGSDATGWSDIYSFKTSSNDGAFSFLLAGDPQIGATAAAYDTKNWNTTIDKAKSWFGDDIEFLMTAGDQVNVHTTLEQYEGFMSNSWLRSIPTVTTVGNHDNGATYSNYFTYKDVDQTTISNAGEFGGDYWFAYDSALIMSLNFNNTSVAVHKAFMESAINDFTTYYGEPTWTIAVFHQPIYSQGVRAEEEFTIAQRDLLAPVMSELGVDVVLTGHDHVYTRAYMMNGTTVKDEASLYTRVGNDPYGSIYDPSEGDVFYLTANSASGSKYYNLNSNVMPFTCVSSKENTQTITKIDVTWDSISFTTHRTSVNSEVDDILDFFAIHKTTQEDYYSPTLNVPAISYIDSEKQLDLLDGVSAYDNVDGDLTSNVVYSGNVDMSGEFTIKYTVTDSSGNTTEKTRKYIPYTNTQSLGSDIEWSYLDDGSTPYGENSDLYTWATPSFDDSAWKRASSPFGAVKGAEGYHGSYTSNTVLNQYDANGNNLKHYFFRTTFDLDKPESIGYLYGDFHYDDAINIFINGVQVCGYNTGKITNGEGYSGKTSVSNATYGDFTITDPKVISSFDLKEKGNVLAVALYQTNATSSDIFFRFNSLNIGVVNPAQYVTANGVTLTLHELDKGVKDYFIAKGSHDTYRSVKDNMVVHITSTKFGTADEYSYILSDPGVYTVLIRYNDSARSNVFLETKAVVTEPVFSLNGLQLTIDNLDGVKVVRTAYGEYTTPGDIKRAEGSRSFSAKAISSNEYMIQYRENGRISVAVVYQNGYSVVHYCDIVKKEPSVERSGNTITFGNLEDMKVLRYVKGSYSTSSEIKRAQGSVALTSSKIVDGKITVTLSAGTYSFCVQYNDESYNYYIFSIE